MPASCGSSRSTAKLRSGECKSSYFGSTRLALIDGGPRSATATAATDLVASTFWEFRPLVERALSHGSFCRR